MQNTKAPARPTIGHRVRSLEHALEPERAAAGGRSAGWGGVVAALIVLGGVLAGPLLIGLYRVAGG
jgi:hypothetical protein